MVRRSLIRLTVFDDFIFRPITEEEFFDAVEEELDKRDQMEQESNESNRLKQQAVTPNEHHSQSVGLDFKIRVSRKFLRSSGLQKKNSKNFSNLFVEIRFGL